MTTGTQLSFQERTMREKSVKRTFDKAKVVAHKAVAKLPKASVEGFHRGRQAGHDFIENVPYGAGAVVGFTVGVGEAIVDCAISAIGRARSGKEEVAAETA